MSNTPPSSWRVEKLSSVLLSIRNGTTQTQNQKRLGLPVTRIETISDGVINANKVGWVEIYDQDFSEYLMQPGDILLSHINSLEQLGKCAIYEGKPEVLLHGMNLLNLRSNQELIDPYYLLYYLRSAPALHAIRTRAGQAVNQASINQKSLQSISIPLPPLPEQRRIVAILRQADMLRQLRRDASEKAGELEKALFYEFFGDPDPERNDRGWISVKIGNVLDVGTGGTPSRSVKEYYGGSHNWVKTTELKDDIIRGTEETLTDKGLSNSNAKIYPVNTVLVAMYGQGQTRGRTAKLGVPAAVNQACGAFLPSNELLPDFLWHWFQNSYNRIRSLSRGGPQENLNLQILKDLYIPKPPKDVQLRFTIAIEQHRKIWETILVITDRLDELFQSITARAFTGELTTSWREKHKEELQRAAVERDKKLGVRGEVPTFKDIEEGRLTPEEEEQILQVISQSLGQFAVNASKMREAVSPLFEMSKNIFEPLIQSIRQSMQAAAPAQLPNLAPDTGESFLRYIDNLPVPQEKRAVIETLDTNTVRVLKLAGTYPAYFTANDLEAGEFGGITTLQAETSLRTLQALGFVKLVQIDGLLRYRLTVEDDYGEMPYTLQP